MLTEALPAYVQARAADRDATIGLTDLLARAFAFSALHPLQSITLGMLDAAAPLRAAVAHRFMYGRR
jgi:2-polyprenyl-6-methoxyphenol hydroxylase-like FAD-dependent oxidoreductase